MSGRNLIHLEVEEHYAAAARTAAAGGSACCGGDERTWGAVHYDTVADELGALPDAVALASLGCGNPTAVAELRAGEVVLDLGSGGGIDVLLSARRVGPTGRAIGVDMTDDMLDLARRNSAEAGATNVEFRKGHIEELPIEDGSVDVIISNCVINLAADKDAVFREMFRVLRPGGRVGVSDVVTEDRLSAEERSAQGTYAGCIAGALPVGAYTAGLEAAGFAEVSVTFTSTVGDGIHAAIVRAVRPGSPGCCA